MQTGNILNVVQHKKAWFLSTQSVLSLSLNFPSFVSDDMAQGKQWTSYSLFLTTYTDA